MSKKRKWGRRGTILDHEGEVCARSLAHTVRAQHLLLKILLDCQLHHTHPRWIGLFEKAQEELKSAMDWVEMGITRRFDEDGNLIESGGTGKGPNDDD